MATRKIQDKTVKDIFENLLGKENAKNVLEKIQKEYDKGVRGDDLKDFARRTIAKIVNPKSDFEKFGLSIIAVLVGPHA